jgi:hypothetical protein
VDSSQSLSVLCEHSSVLQWSTNLSRPLQCESEYMDVFPMRNKMGFINLNGPFGFVFSKHKDVTNIQ